MHRLIDGPCRLARLMIDYIAWEIYDNFIMSLALSSSQSYRVRRFHFDRRFWGVICRYRRREQGQQRCTRPLRQGGQQWLLWEQPGRTYEMIRMIRIHVMCIRPYRYKWPELVTAYLHEVNNNYNSLDQLLCMYVLSWTPFREHLHFLLSRGDELQRMWGNSPFWALSG